MKTPLSVIELITQGQDAGDSSFESIKEELDLMRQGLDTVLYMARLETFEQDFYVEKVSLEKIANDVVHENKRIFIRSYVYPPIFINSEIMVYTDAKWCRFIFNQVLINAIKYSGGNGENIIISAFTKDLDVIFEIQDSGVEIPKLDLIRVFPPFYTGENGRKFKESTGMGLYLVKNIIEKLNYKIEIESDVEKGTKVRIIFQVS